MSGPSSLGPRLARIADRLSRAYGRPRRPMGDPLGTLVQTVLSQNTSDLNSERAYRSLRTALPTWSSVARAAPRRVESAIRHGGLARTKSRRIVRLLRELERREGRLDLRPLRRLCPREAERRLLALPGVGPKTRACVLLFGCGHPAFPVDTHVLRVSHRLGVVPPRASAERVRAILEPAIPPGRALDLHLNLIRLGRRVCRPRRPRCAACPLRRLCRYAEKAA